jgi:hypothetical protein
MVIAGIALVLTMMWIAAYFSSPGQPTTIRSVYCAGAVAFTFAFIGSWLWGLL